LGKLVSSNLSFFNLKSGGVQVVSLWGGCEDKVDNVCEAPDAERN
jgi:hypothetical protein